jgi:hypothetical protein
MGRRGRGRSRVGGIIWTLRVGKHALGAIATRREVTAGNHPRHLGRREMADASRGRTVFPSLLGLSKWRRIIYRTVSHGGQDGVDTRVVSIRTRWGRRIVAFGGVIIGISIFLSSIRDVGVGRSQKLMDGRV